MAFFTSAVGVLKTLVIALGAGLGIWGVVNLMEGYGNDNPGAEDQENEVFADQSLDIFLFHFSFLLILQSRRPVS